MKVNAKKCKELMVCLFGDTPVLELELLTIDGIPIDVVDCHNVFGILY